MQEKKILRFKEFGFLTQKEVTLTFEINPDFSGVSFLLAEKQELIEASLDFLLSGQRNTVLGTKKSQLFFVEHLLAASALLRVKNLRVTLDGSSGDSSEIPLLDGSASKWLEILHKLSLNFSSEQEDSTKIATKKLKNSFYVENKDKEQTIVAYPYECFKVIYLFECPFSQKKEWFSWQEKDGIEKIAQARTFGSLAENSALGVTGKWLSYDQTGYDQALRFPGEPAYHKILDLIGDLSLSKINPLDLGVCLVCQKSGHQLNHLLAEKISSNLWEAIS